MISVTVVLGLPGAGKSAWIERQLATRPASARWAVLGQGAEARSRDGDGARGADGADDARAGDGRAAAAGLLRQPLGPGCACCALRPALRVALGRLLRTGAWDRLILEADGAAHAEQLVDALREPPLDTALRVEAIVLIVDGSHPDSWQTTLSAMASTHFDAAPSRRANLLACASQVVINRPGDDGQALAARLAAAGPFGRPVELDFGGSDGDGGTGRARADRPPPLRWAPPLVRPLGRWPATPARDRRALQAALAGWAARHPGLAATGAWPTARAWYGWSHRPGAPMQWGVSAYRLEGRLDAPAAAGAVPPDEAAAYAELVALIDALHAPATETPARSGATASAP